MDTNRGAPAVDGLNPLEVGWREIIRCEGEGQGLTLKRCVELDVALTSSAHGGVAKGHVEQRVGRDGVIELQLNHASFRKITEVD